MIGSAVGPNVHEITVVVHARLPAKGVVFLILRRIAICCEYEAPCAWWPYACTGSVPDMVSFIAAGLI